MSRASAINEAARPHTGRVRGTIELHIRKVAELFDSFDPCPIHKRDLDADAEEYMVASVRELRHPADSVIFHIDELDGGTEPDMVERAIHSYFARKVGLVSRELNALLRRGWISLGIGVAFLVALLTLSEVVTLRLSAGRFRDGAERKPRDRWLGGDVAAARNLPV